MSKTHMGKYASKRGNGLDVNVGEKKDVRSKEEDPFVIVLH